MDFTPTDDDMERAKIVLTDALPYEFDMLDAASRYMQTTAFSKLAEPKNQTEWLTRNATVESFWTHVRCLLEFFNRDKSGDFTPSSASAKDFTDDSFWTSTEMKNLWGNGKLSETINEQISHVGFCRKGEQSEKLGPHEMVRVKAIIEKEVREFERCLRGEFRRFWKVRQPVRLVPNLLGNACMTSVATNQMGSWKNY
jgi:hypothetical protein